MLQLSDKCPKRSGSSRDTFCGKLFDNAGQTIFYEFSRTKVKGQGHKDPETKCDTP